MKLTIAILGTLLLLSSCVKDHIDDGWMPAENPAYISMQNSETPFCWECTLTIIQKAAGTKDVVIKEVFTQCDATAKEIKRIEELNTNTHTYYVGSTQVTQVASTSCQKKR